MVLNFGAPTRAKARSCMHLTVTLLPERLKVSRVAEADIIKCVRRLIEAFYSPIFMP